MLGVAVTTCSSSPGPLPGCWSSGLCLGTQCTCPGRDSTFSCAGQQQRWAHVLVTRTGHWLGQSQALPQVKHCFQWYLHTGPTSHTRTGSSSWAGRDRSLVQAHTQGSPDARAHVHVHGPFYAPFCLFLLCSSRCPSPAHSFISFHSSRDPFPTFWTLRFSSSSVAKSQLAYSLLRASLFLVFVSVVFACQVCVSMFWL